MSETHCCITRAKLTKKQIATCAKVAKEYEYTFTYCNLPGTGLQGWFSGQNLGHPFDMWTARKIKRALIEADLAKEFGLEESPLTASI